MSDDGSGPNRPQQSGDGSGRGDGTPLEDVEIDRRKLLLAVPALGVAAAGCYAGLNAMDGEDGDPEPGETETPFGYGGTPTDQPGGGAGPDDTATPLPGDTGTPGSGDTATESLGGGGSGGGGGANTATPGDYGIQGYGEFGYGGVFP